MKKGSFTKKYTINKILDFYNVSREDAERIYNKTYEKIRYNARKEGLKDFHSVRETFFSIFAPEKSTFSTYINPGMPAGNDVMIFRSTGEESTLVGSVGSRLSSLREKYAEVEVAYQQFIYDHDLEKLNRTIKDFKKNSSDYLKVKS